VLLIGMFAVPWYHVGLPRFTAGGQTFGGESFDSNVLKGPGSFFSIVALIVLAYGAFGVSRSASAAPAHSAAHGG
jgi:hypothetical protein